MSSPRCRLSRILFVAASLLDIVGLGLCSQALAAADRSGRQGSHLEVEEEFGFKFIRIEAGTFTMGSPAKEPGRDEDETQHEVTLTRNFWLSATEVTQAQWEKLMGENPSTYLGCDDCPVEEVSWFDAADYANRLSAKAGLEPCYEGTGESLALRDLDCTGYRLPTEAEWEYAARAGTTSWRYGDFESIAWSWKNSGRKIRPVGGKQPNAWGLYDMLGNVWEWTGDRHEAFTAAPAIDPVGPSTGVKRVIRGGAFWYQTEYVRSAERGTSTPWFRWALLGFRLARSDASLPGAADGTP